MRYYEQIQLFLKLICKSDRLQRQVNVPPAIHYSTEAKFGKVSKSSFTSGKFPW